MSVVHCKQAVEDTERERTELRAVGVGALREAVTDVASPSLLAEPKRLCRLKQAVDDMFLHRAESKQALEAWQQACAVFHARYDGLAFPGGLSSGLERLAAGDLLTAETARVYLELHPYFFRSPYNATMLMRRLKKLVLPAHLQQRFDAAREAARARQRRQTENG